MEDNQVFETIEELRASGQLEDYLKQVGSMNLLEDQEIADLVEADDTEILGTMYEYLQQVLEDMAELTEEESKLVDLDRVRQNIETIEKHVEFVDEEAE